MNSVLENFMLYRFGEGLDPDVLGKAAEALQTCDLFMTIGTSSVVYPAAGFAAQVNLLLVAAGCPPIQTAQDPVLKTQGEQREEDRKKKGKKQCHYVLQTSVNALRHANTESMCQTSNYCMPAGRDTHMVDAIDLCLRVLFSDQAVVYLVHRTQR